VPSGMRRDTDYRLMTTRNVTTNRAVEILLCGVGDENSGDMLTVPYIASGCRQDMGGLAGLSRLKMILKSYPELTSRETRSESRIAPAALQLEGVRAGGLLLPSQAPELNARFDMTNVASLRGNLLQGARRARIPQGRV
jgi:hypothetical protein